MNVTDFIDLAQSVAIFCLAMGILRLSKRD